MGTTVQKCKAKKVFQQQALQESSFPQERHERWTSSELPQKVHTHLLTQATAASTIKPFAPLCKRCTFRRSQQFLLILFDQLVEVSFCLVSLSLFPKNLKRKRKEVEDNYFQTLNSTLPSGHPTQKISKYRYHVHQKRWAFTEILAEKSSNRITQWLGSDQDCMAAGLNQSAGWVFHGLFNSSSQMLTSTSS